MDSLLSSSLLTSTLEHTRAPWFFRGPQVSAYISLILLFIIYLFIISRALQGHSTDVQYNLTQNIFTVTT